ncbi:MAG: hypothetical protein ACYDAP_03500 [Thermoplasmataceae archaeon]
MGTRKRIGDLYYPILLIVSALLLDLWVLRNSINMSLVQSADWPIPIMSMKALSLYALPSWSFQDMAPNGTNMFLLAYGFFASITHSPATIQKIFYYIPWALTPFAAYLLLKYMGLKRYLLIVFSFIYQFGPWINGQFMDGEPVNVILYLFIPLIVYVSLKYSGKPVILFFMLSLLMIIPSFFTLEAPFFYLFLLLPVFMYLAFNKAFKEALIYILTSAFSFLAIVAFNAYSLGPYIAGFSQVSSSGSSLLSSFTGFPPAVEARFWMLAFLFISILALLILLGSKKSSYKNFFLSMVVVSAFLLAVYPGLGIDSVGIFLLERFPAFGPFINPNEFLLYLWLTLFLTIAYSTVMWESGKLEISTYKAHAKVLRLGRKYALSVFSVGIALLLASSGFIEIQSFGSHDTGVYLLTQGTHFSKAEVQPQYMELYDFLNNHNASFGLSYHTIIFPENPNYSLPYYIGEQMIPGYIGLFSKNVSQQIINGINGNDSNFLMLLSLLGIRYLAVLNIPGSSWYGSRGSPQTSMWGTQYIFVGNYTYYLRDLGNLSGLSKVYDANGLWIFRNNFYESPILYGSHRYADNIYNGDYSAMYNLTSISANVLGNTSYYYSGSNFSGSSALSMTLERSSTGVVAYTYVDLEPNSTYRFSFRFNTTGQLRTYYGNGQNAGMVFFNVTPSSTDVIGGTAITINPEYIANGTYSSTFRTPGFSAPLPAKVIFQFQPPLHHYKIEVSMHNVSLERVNGSNLFSRDFRPANFSSGGLTTIMIHGIPAGSSVFIDQDFGTGWYFRSKNGTKTPLDDNSIGLLSLYAPEGRSFQICYGNQYIYDDLLYLSFGSILVFASSVTAFFTALWVRRRFKG